MNTNDRAAHGAATPVRSVASRVALQRLGEALCAVARRFVNYIINEPARLIPSVPEATCPV